VSIQGISIKTLHDRVLYDSALTGWSGRCSHSLANRAICLTDVDALDGAAVGPIIGAIFQVIGDRALAGLAIDLIICRNHRQPIVVVLGENVRAA
jgi:hypothetical protein